MCVCAHETVLHWYVRAQAHAPVFDRSTVRPFAVNSSVHLLKKFDRLLIFCLNTLIFITQTHMQKFSTYFPAVFFKFDLKVDF